MHLEEKNLGVTSQCVHDTSLEEMPNKSPTSYCIDSCNALADLVSEVREIPSQGHWA